VGAAERRVSGWVDLIGDLLVRPTAQFPHRALMAQLHETFGCQVAWSWVEGPGRNGFDVHLPMPGFPAPEERELFDAVMSHYPVFAWFRATRSLAPTTVGRVPLSMSTRTGRAVLADHMRPREVEQQLVIVHRWSGHRDVRLRSFVVARGHRDFSDDDVRVAAAVQPLILLLDRQVSLCAGSPAVLDDRCDLTGRELAVLTLLERGLTAAAIGRQLGIAERTVHRHLQSLYRKLDARDRLSAVLTARDLGLLESGYTSSSDRGNVVGEKCSAPAGNIQGRATSSKTPARTAGSSLFSRSASSGEQRISETPR
jgi:DNA-binding CsgD family transcriptional regulator